MLFSSKLRGMAFSTLTVSQAAARTAIIRPNSLYYSSHLVLHKGNSYQGFTNITFEAQNLENTPELLRIDFQGKEVTGLMINQAQIAESDILHKDGSINIPGNLIHLGKPNNIAVQYSNRYNQDGNGCVSFIDTDQKQYLYTQFEPYYANRVFPLFDQPDLKAPLTLTLACPQDWQTVLSNEFPNANSTRTISISSITARVIEPYRGLYDQFIERYQSQIPGDYKVTSFIPTLPLSSYLYSFVVGPYKELVVNQNAQKQSLNIPMRLYSIESLYPELRKLAPFIEEITVKSMDFFQNYFGCKYPFSKYDQVFAHEYKWGAMENAGLVTFNDAYLFKDKVSDQRMLSFGNTIVHQLSHHWFGNLVTMKWWDDLWLNQSFAEYISHFCLQKIKGNLHTIYFQSAMLSFINRKAWGYSEDQLVTTHPIRTEVPDTHTAESIFDGITYSKGAATMKQLMYLIGEESFSKALSAYFAKHAYSNAVLDDLLASMAPYFISNKNQLSLVQWKQMWLESPGTNTLSCRWQPGKNKASIIQGHDRGECPTLRLHIIKVGISLGNHEVLVREVTVMPQEITQVTLDVPAEAVAVLLNYEDYTFAKVEIDGRSRSYFKQHLHRLTSTVSRSLIWKSYYDMVKDSRITSQEFQHFCLRNLQDQHSDPIFEEQLNNLYQAIRLFTPKSYRNNLYAGTFRFLKDQLLSLPEQPQHQNRRVIIREKLIDFCHGQKQAEILQKWYKGKACQLERQSLNNSLRWKIVIKLFSRNDLTQEQKRQVLRDMQSRDSSDIMVNRKITCEALIASAQQLQTMYLNFFNYKEGRSLNNFINQLRGFNNEIHEKTLRDKYLHRFFQDAQRLLKAEVTQSEKWFIEGDYLEGFLAHFDPVIDATIDDLHLKTKGFGSLTSSNQKIKRTILKTIDILERRTRAYQCWDNYQKA